MRDASQQLQRPAQVGTDGAALTKLVYQSRATEAFSPDGMNALLTTAVSRNEREHLTGTLVYDRGQFVQWLEGPAEALGRVVGSIKNDPRHDGFEVLRTRRIERRTFRDWRMRLAVRKSGPSLVPAGTLRAEDGPIDALMSYPEAAPSLLRVLFGDDQGPDAMPDPVLPEGFHDKVASVVSGLGFSPVFGDGDGLGLPADAAKEQLPQLRASAAELVRIFTVGRNDIEPRRIEAICRSSARGLDEFVRLFGMTTKGLGDLWQNNACSEADIAVALSELQIVYSRMRRHGTVQPDRDISDFRILAAQLPGDLHIVGSILKADVLRSRGWDAIVRFPSSTRELVDELSASHFDGLVISTSRVLSDPAALPQVERLVRDIRASSRNRDIRIVVGGRIFSDRAEAWTAVGADASSDTPLGLPALFRSFVMG